MRVCLSVLIAAAFLAHACAAPVNNSLLSLVPAGAEIVAGIQDPHNPDSHGRLLLVTHNNNLDLNDWLALTGVDGSMQVDELIEVAASSSQSELNDHLLLISGRFNRDQVFRAARKNGAATSEYNGVRILLIAPFARERQEISSIRWMAIIDDRTSIFGTPELVRKSLDRYASHEVPDAPLLQRLEQLHPDVNSWNVLVMSAPMLIRHVVPGQLHSPWTHILDGAHELTIGIHYGSKARIDFAASTDGDQQAASFAGKLTQPRLRLTDLSGMEQLRIQSVSVQRNHVQGSMTVPGREFDAWLAAVVQSHASASSAQ